MASLHQNQEMPLRNSFDGCSISIYLLCMSLFLIISARYVHIGILKLGKSIELPTHPPPGMNKLEAFKIKLLLLMLKYL